MHVLTCIFESLTDAFCSACPSQCLEWLQVPSTHVTVGLSHVTEKNNFYFRGTEYGVVWMDVFGVCMAIYLFSWFLQCVFLFLVLDHTFKKRGRCQTILLYLLQWQWRHTILFYSNEERRRDDHEINTLKFRKKTNITKFLTLNKECDDKSRFLHLIKSANSQAQGCHDCCPHLQETTWTFEQQYK